MSVNVCSAFFFFFCQMIFLNLFSKGGRIYLKKFLDMHKVSKKCFGRVEWTENEYKGEIVVVLLKFVFDYLSL